MNIANILATADFIERRPESFSYAEVHCGTHACIAGYAAALALKYDWIPPSRAVNLDAGMAAEFLGLDGCDSHRLFFSAWEQLGDATREITPGLAVRVLRNLAEHGEVDWYRAAVESRGA